MKLIDEKGRLFGKLHFFDFLAIIFILLVIFAVFFITPKKPTVINDYLTDMSDITDYIWIELYAQAVGIIPEVAELVKVGDENFSPDDQSLLKIDKIISVEDVYFDKGRGKTTKRMNIKFLMRVYKTKDSYFWGERRILVGDVFNFRSSFYRLHNCEITKFGDIIEE